MGIREPLCCMSDMIDVSSVVLLLCFELRHLLGLHSRPGARIYVYIILLHFESIFMVGPSSSPYAAAT